MFKQNFNNWYKQQVGWTGTIIIGIMLILAIYGLVQKINLNSNSAYAKGILTGKHKGSKGSWYWDFAFYANENGFQNGFESSAPISDCKECNIGDKLLLNIKLTILTIMN